MSAYFNMHERLDFSSLIWIKVISKEWSIQKYVALHYLMWIGKARDQIHRPGEPENLYKDNKDKTFEEIMEAILKYKFDAKISCEQLSEDPEDKMKTGYSLRFPIENDNERMISINIFDINRSQTIMISFSESNENQPWRHNEEFFYHHDYSLEQSKDYIAEAYIDVMKILIKES